MVRHHRLQSLVRISEFVAAAPVADGSWDIHVIRYGALAASAKAASVHDATSVAQAAELTAQVFAAPPSPSPASSIGEAHLVLKWCEQPGVRIIRSSEAWHSPWPSQLQHHSDVQQLAQARQTSALVAPVRKFARYTAPR
jgi:DNA polymerase-3 subunit epsilon